MKAPTKGARAQIPLICSWVIQQAKTITSHYAQLVMYEASYSYCFTALPPRTRSASTRVGPKGSCARLFSYSCKVVCGVCVCV